MLKKKILILSCLLMIVPLISNFAQGIAISDDIENPHPSSILDISSTNKGLLLPRMTTAQRDAINSPAESLFIFNTETKCFEIFVEDIWHSLWCAEDIEEPFNCGNTLNYEGYDYQTVQIGDQCWFAENLRYDNGCTSTAWVDYSDEGWCGYYDDNELTYSEYGLLYQWSAIMNGSTEEGVQGICPEGWRIPTNADWKILEGTVDATYGVGNSEWDNIGWRGSDAGCELRTPGITHWENPNICATNNSNFSALGAGYRFTDGIFTSWGYHGGWWTSSQTSGTQTWCRYLYSQSGQVYSDPYSKVHAFSVRCLKN